MTYGKKVTFGVIFRMRAWLTILRSSVLSEVEFLKRKKKSLFYFLLIFQSINLGRARIIQKTNMSQIHGSADDS